MPDGMGLHSKIQDVQLVKLRVSQGAQRDLRPSRVDHLAAEFDPEKLGYPVVNLRDGHYYIIDGQHRVEATKRYLGDGWEKQLLTCRAYSGMTEKQEAQMFDDLNNMLAVSAFDRFKVRVTGGKAEEVAVKKVVEHCGLHISREKHEGALSSVGVLLKVYKRSDAATLGRALKIIYQSFGDPGLTSQIIDGVALLCERYNGAIKDAEVIERLHDMRGGVGALMSRATTLRKQTGQNLAICVAAATVDVMNAKRGGKKVASWWKE